MYSFNYTKMQIILMEQCLETIKKNQDNRRGEELQPAAELFCSSAFSVLVVIKPALNTRKNTETMNHELPLSRLPTSGG